MSHHYEFNSKTILYPLHYILDIMDKYQSKINSLRFNSDKNIINAYSKFYKIGEK